MRKTLLGLLAFLMAASSYSQKTSLKGIITDTTEKKNLQYAVVSLIREQDSILAKFARTKPDGSFVIQGLKPGNYILTVTRPKYAGYTDHVEIKENESKDIGVLSIIPASKLLEEIVIRQNRAIVVKGDTIEYKADSFKVAMGANVQELLKRLPGIEVDKDGKITAQGKQVERVLVDGEEFFTDDPAVVTKNLRADAIDKVQAYDKKSDQAEFTGVDDGVQSKTLNLVLKEDKKKGYFGKIAPAVGTNQRYSNEAMFNLFKGKKKAAVYGIHSNTGKIGLGWEDRDKFGGGSDFADADVEMGAGYIMINNSDYDDEFGDWGNSYWGEGVPVALKTGAHFSNKWGKDKYHLNSNYSFKRQTNDAEGGSLYKYLLPDSAYYSLENHRNISKENRHLFTGFYDIKIDSLSSFKIRFNAQKMISFRQQYTNSGTNDEFEETVNRNSRNLTTNSNNEAALLSVLWRKKFKKAGRTLSVSASQKISDKNSNGYFDSYTQYYDTGTIIDRDSLEQYKENTGRNLKTQARAVLTEKLSAKIMVELNYTLGVNNTLNDQQTFDKSLNGKYENYNTVFSNRYSLNILSNTGGVKFQINGKKITGNAGINIGRTSYSHKDSAGILANKFNYTNLLPSSRLTYKLGPQKSFGLYYNGSNRPPSISQIQPLTVNTDPLNLTIGNPNLDQSFNHNFGLNYNDFKTLSGRNIWANGNIDFTNKAIVSSETIDAGGKRTVQYVNAAGSYNYGFYISNGYKLKKLDMRASFRINTNGGRSINYINGTKNESNSFHYGIGPGLSKYKDGKYSIYLNYDFSNNANKSSLNNRQTNFWTQNITNSFHFYFGKEEKFTIGTELNINLREKTDAFDKNNNVYNWSAYTSLKLFKNNTGEIRLEVQDILNQKIGFDRQTTSNYISERNYEVLRRYALLSFVWNFSKSPGQK
jgi:hypothetical protein